MNGACGEICATEVQSLVRAKLRNRCQQRRKSEFQIVECAFFHAMVIAICLHFIFQQFSR